MDEYIVPGKLKLKNVKSGSGISKRKRNSSALPQNSRDVRKNDDKKLDKTQEQPESSGANSSSTSAPNNHPSTAAHSSKTNAEDKKLDKTQEQPESSGANSSSTSAPNNHPSTAAHSSKTNAELAFEARKMKLQMDRIMKKAEKSHKERVESFNQLLSSVPEFNDIPKVSWTK